MATVRMAHGLRSDILERAIDVYDRSNPEPKLSDELRDEIVGYIKAHPLYKAAERMTTELNSSFPVLKSNTSSTYRAESVILGGLQRFNAVPEEVARITVIGSTGFSSDRELLLKNPAQLLMSNSYGTKNFDVSKPTFDEGTWARIEDIRDQHYERIKERNDARSQYRSAIREILDGCNTLKQLLDRWPEVEHLVPSDVMNKHREPAPKRGAAAKEAVSINADMISKANAAIVTAKITGSLCG